LFSACSVFTNGLQIVTSRMLDARRTFVVGLGFMVGLAADLHPAFSRTLPATLRPLAGSFLVLGTVTALVLNGQMPQPQRHLRAIPSASARYRGTVSKGDRSDC
jgi:xanthine/uracil permease